MLITKILLIAAPFFVSFTSEETNFLSHVLLKLSGDRSSRMKKAYTRQEEPKYFEQCHPVNMWKEHLGHVSVLAFLDPSWQYSFRQAVMLNILSSRFRKSGFSDIRFFVISPPPNFMQHSTEDDEEIEAWIQIATIFPAMENPLNTNIHVFKEDKSEIIFFQDDSQSQLWKRFRASRNQVIVIDRCSKLTYQVMVPWSILYFPYVKAAILSTYQEDPCGECNSSMPDYKEYLSGLMDGTEKKTDPRKVNNSDPIQTIEHLENVNLHFNESLEEKHGAYTVLPIPLDEATDSTDDRFDLVNVTEFPIKSGIAYQYDNDTTESSIEKNHLSTVESREELINSNVNESIVIVESQRDVFVHGAFVKTNSINYEEMTDRVLMLNEPVTGNNVMNEGISAIKTMSSNIANNKEVTSNEKNANVCSNLTEYEQNDSVDKSDFEDAARIGVHSLPLPLRVIMYAPHVHKNGKKTKYSHLILKADDPNYHEHLDSGISVIPSTDLPQNSDLQIVNSKEYNQSGIKINGHRETNQKYIFDQDESPGFYGEIADYWKSCEDSDITDRNETSNNDYNNSTIGYNEYRNNISDHSTNFSKSSETNKSYSNVNITVDINMEDSANPSNIVGLNNTNSLKSVIEDEQVDRDDKARNKLIEHYSKLLAWIDYKLKK